MPGRGGTVDVFSFLLLRVCLIPCCAVFWIFVSVRQGVCLWGGERQGGGRVRSLSHSPTAKEKSPTRQQSHLCVHRALSSRHDERHSEQINIKNSHG